MHVAVFIVLKLIFAVVTLCVVDARTEHVTTQWTSGKYRVERNWMHQTSDQDSLLCSLPVGNDECHKSIQIFCEALNSGTSWANEMLDATTKYPDGVYAGQTVHLASFDACLDVETVLLDPTEKFYGKYCLAEYSIADQEDTQPDQSDNQVWLWLKHLEDGMFGHKAVLQTAWCIPSTCSNEDLRNIIVTLLNDDYINLNVPENKCQTADNSSLTLIDIVTICLLALAISLAIASTVYDSFTEPKESLLLHQLVDQRPQIFLAFSLRANWRRIFESDGDANLKYINGLRALSIGWVVLGHTFFYYNEQMPVTNVFYQKENSQYAAYMGFVSAHLAADTFLLLSGVLTCYTFYGTVTKSGSVDVINIIKYYIHRYVRLTPSLAIMVLLSVSLLNYAGSGPLWYSSHDVVKNNCKSNWWTTLLYIDNYVHPNNRCLPQTWYLAVDMQLFWLSPIVLIPLWTKPRIAKMLVAFLFVVGFVLPFTISYLMEIQAGNIVLWQDDILERYNTSYYGTAYTRFPAWLMGIIVGYILHTSKHGKKKTLSWKVVALGWTSSAALMLTCIYGQYPFQQYTHQYKHRLETAFYLAFHRPAWALGIAWIVYACCRGYGGIVSRVLSWRVFQPLSHLSYGIFLTHVSVINLLVGFARAPVYLSDFHTFQMFLVIFAIAILWAVPLSLLIHLPVHYLEKAINGKKKVVKDEVLPDLPVGLRTPVPFKKPSHMYRLSEMKQINHKVEQKIASSLLDTETREWLRHTMQPVIADKTLREQKSVQPDSVVSQNQKASHHHSTHDKLPIDTENVGRELTTDIFEERELRDFPAVHIPEKTDPYRETNSKEILQLEESKGTIPRRVIESINLELEHISRTPKDQDESEEVDKNGQELDNTSEVGVRL